MTGELPEEPGRVPVSELRDTLELWRAMAESDSTPTANMITLRWCADELEAVIEDYTNE